MAATGTALPPAFTRFLVFAGILGTVALLAWWTQHHLHQRGIATGFAFLQKQASFDIGESLIAYSPDDTYGRALAVGLLNTLKVSVLGIILATVFGIFIGISRLSSNGLIAGLSAALVELVRNVPLLLQLLLWYSLITASLPPAREALEPLHGWFLSNRGLQMPKITENQTGLLTALLTGLGSLVALLLTTPRTLPRRTASAVGIISLLVLLVLLFASPLELPEKTRFGYRGGWNLTPECTALLFGLTLYSGVFIGEILRSGLQSVPRGQHEAAAALGLSPATTMGRIILPQALRLSIPPLVSQYLTLVKSSSLAVAIGYPDLVGVANVTINQTGQALEGIVLIMLAYMTISLFLSSVLNRYNKRVMAR